MPQPNPTQRPYNTSALIVSFFFSHYSRLNALTLIFDRATTTQASKQATNYASIIILLYRIPFHAKQNAIPYYLPIVTAKQKSTPAHAVFLFNAINKNTLPRSTIDTTNNAIRNLYAPSLHCRDLGLGHDFPPLVDLLDTLSLRYRL